MHIPRPYSTLLKIWASLTILFVGYKFYSIEHSYPRVDEIARKACQQLVARAEKTGKPLTGTVLNLKKMLDSPIVRYHGLPFALKSHQLHGYDTFHADPIAEPGNDKIIYNDQEVSASELPPFLQEELKKSQEAVEADLRAMGAVPYTVESSLKNLLEALHRAQKNEKAVVIASKHGDSLHSLLGKFMEYSKGEKFPGVTVIIITDRLSQAQLSDISQGLGTEPYKLSYKVGLHDFLPW
jgi:hypothetical protein